MKEIILSPINHINIVRHKFSSHGRKHYYILEIFHWFRFIEANKTNCWLTNYRWWATTRLATIELPVSYLPRELLTLPLIKNDAPAVPSNFPVIENSLKESTLQISHKINSLNTFINHELSVLRYKMDPFCESLQQVLSSKQHLENMNTLQENMVNLHIKTVNRER